MDLDIVQSYNKRLITPYHYRDRTYYLLFYRNGVMGPFYVQDAPYEANMLLTIGEIKRKSDNQVVGNIFYTQVQVSCEGAYLLAYSGVFRASVNNRPAHQDLTMDLRIKTPYMHVFSQVNKATLVVSPMLKTTIKQNLEI
jgi:hypothetical protein